MNAIDAVTADLRAHEARQDFLSKQSDKRTDWICSQVIHAEFVCKAQTVSDFIESDDDFRNEICDAIARIVRDPRNMMNLHRVLVAFDHAVERQAGEEYDQWRAA
jgi:hypothetical protein